jgi:hypothetical protein
VEFPVGKLFIFDLLDFISVVKNSSTPANITKLSSLLFTKIIASVFRCCASDCEPEKHSLSIDGPNHSLPVSCKEDDDSEHSNIEFMKEGMCEEITGKSVTEITCKLGSQVRFSN